MSGGSVAGMTGPTSAETPIGADVNDVGCVYLHATVPRPTDLDCLLPLRAVCLLARSVYVMHVNTCNL